jgi:hypothetical protein
VASRSRVTILAARTSAIVAPPHPTRLSRGPTMSAEW